MKQLGGVATPSSWVEQTQGKGHENARMLHVKRNV